MTQPVILCLIICATVLILVFGLVGIFAWIDRYTYSEITRIRTLETQMAQLNSESRKK